jgi:hypothetical protein
MTVTASNFVKAELLAFCHMANANLTSDAGVKEQAQGNKQADGGDEQEHAEAVVNLPIQRVDTSVTAVARSAFRHGRYWRSRRH